MYVNEEYATSARILRGEDAVSWYNKNFGTSWTLTNNGGSSSTFYGRKLSQNQEPISVLENGSYYWFASAFSSEDGINVLPDYRLVHNGGDHGFRDSFLILLNSNALIDTNIGDGSSDRPYGISEKIVTSYTSQEPAKR